VIWDQIIVEYAPGSNGGGLLLWACQQPHFHGNKGITEADAIIFAHALETKLMEKHKNK
jgi:hypothetical protein